MQTPQLDHKKCESKREYNGIQKHANNFIHFFVVVAKIEGPPEFLKCSLAVCIVASIRRQREKHS